MNAVEVLKMDGVTGPVNDHAQANYKKRLRLVSLIARHSAVLSVNGLSKMVLEYGAPPDPPGATAVMDLGEHRLREDEVAFRLEATPLPMTHCDVKRPVPGVKDAWEWIPRAEVDAHPEAVDAPARRVGELVEKTFVEAVLNARGAAFVSNTLAVESDGRETRYRVGVYDLVLRMIEAARANNFYGPFAVLCGEQFDRGMDCDAPNAAGKTLRQTVRDIDFDQAKPDERLILDVKRIEVGMPADGLVLLQLTPEVVRVADGMSLRVVPWEEGYKIVTVTCPQVRADFYSKAGVVIASRS